MRILIAPDKFKGSLGAEEVAARIASALRNILPQAEFKIQAVADGGEGTAEVIRAAHGGEWLRCPTHDALGRKTSARYAWLPETRLAILEMSAAAGIEQLQPNEYDPLHASTLGVGEMLHAAARQGAEKILLGLGGSATNDGGVGLARALGFRFFAGHGRELGTSVAKLRHLVRIERPNELNLPAIVGAYDVDHRLLGPDGASRIFGSQKGANPKEVEILEAALGQLADVAAESFGSDHRNDPGAGAAGGLGFGLITFCGATLRPGFEVVSEAIDLPSAIRWSEIVITGEGQLDRQTLAGKAPAGVARLARQFSRPVFAIVGQMSDDLAAQEIFDRVFALDPGGGTLETRAEDLARYLQEKFA